MANVSTMIVQKTLAIIKPEAVRAGKAREIMHLIELANFSIIEKTQLQLTKSRAEEFYEEHLGKPFFGKLVDFMTSGPIWAIVLAKPEVIQGWRDLMGPTDSNKARQEKPKSIRALYGTDGTYNAAHGSDSTESAFREIHFFFPGMVIDQPQDKEALEAHVQEASTYIKQNLEPLLTQALTVLAKQKPSGEKFEAVTFLANWLLNNNPNKPRVVLPGTSVPESMNVEEEDHGGEENNKPAGDEMNAKQDAVDTGEEKTTGASDPEKIPIVEGEHSPDIENDAAVKVQSAYRGYQARKEVEKIKQTK
ncbi:hypothetical protein BSKO_07797 [Bryopsis sp. KO-2023]|nr:hypothetical protein BSKO_07797 [Bryopsis sp. KO-2023]